MDYSSFQGLHDLLKMVLLSTSKEMVVVQTTQVTTVSSYAMEIYQQKFVLLVLYIILQVDPTSI